MTYEEIIEGLKIGGRLCLMDGAEEMPILRALERKGLVKSEQIYSVAHKSFATRFLWNADAHKTG